MYRFIGHLILVVLFTCAVTRCSSLSLNCNPIQTQQCTLLKTQSTNLYRRCQSYATTSITRYSTQLYTTTKSKDDNGTTSSSSSSSKLSNILSKLSNNDLSIPAILFASFLNLLGFTMASPIQPALGSHFNLPLGASFGSLSSAYPLGMFAGVFLWPTLSDIIGRKLVMSITLLGSGVGLILQSYGIKQCWTLESFLAARVLTGCFAGNSPISKAYLADRGSVGVNKGNLAKYLAWKDAASTLAFIVGPVLGGLIYSLFGKGATVLGVSTDSSSSSIVISKQISCVILCSAIASLVASLSVMLFVKNTDKDNEMLGKQQTNKSEVASASSSTESEDKVNDGAADDNSIKDDNNKDTTNKSKSSSNDSSIEIIACPLGSKLWTGVVSVAIVSALYHAADSTFFAFFPSLLQNRLNFDTSMVGMAFTSFAFISFSMSAFVSSRFLKRFGPVAACTTGLSAVGMGLLTLGYAASLPASVGMGITAASILGASALYYTGVPLYGPSIPTMLLQCVPSHKRGAVMGFDGAVNTLARVVSPLIFGEIHRVKGPGACFKVASSCVFTAVAIALSRRWLVLRKAFGKTQIAATTNAK